MRSFSLLPCSVLRYILAFFTLTGSFHANAQTEYFVSVDELTGNFTAINKFPTVSWIQPTGFAYCEARHRYTFCGSRDASHWFLYTVDATTGAIVSKPSLNLFSDDANEKIFNLAYSDNKLYGILRNRSGNTASFVVLDPGSGEYEIISKLDNIKYFTYEPGMVSKDNTRFMFVHVDSSDMWHLSTLSISDGTLLSNLVIPGAITQGTYDDSLDKVVTIQYDAQNTPRLVSIDPSTGNIHTIRNKLPVTGNYGLLGTFAYNRARQAYTFVGPDATGTPYIVTLSPDSSADIFAPFPFVNTSGDNVVGFQFDNILGKMFAIHWESISSDVSSLVIYPNPFFQKATISLPKQYHSVVTTIYTIDGKLVRTLKSIDTANVVLDRNDLAAGMYFIKVTGDGDEVGCAKLVAD